MKILGKAINFFVIFITFNGHIFSIDFRPLPSLPKAFLDFEGDRSLNKGIKLEESASFSDNREEMQEVDSVGKIHHTLRLSKYNRKHSPNYYLWLMKEKIQQNDFEAAMNVRDSS